MMNEESKKEAIRIVEGVRDMRVPAISITPSFFIEEKEWKKLAYLVIETMKSIEKQVGSPLVINIVDIIGGIDD